MTASYMVGVRAFHILAVVEQSRYRATLQKRIHIIGVCFAGMQLGCACGKQLHAERSEERGCE